MRQPEVLGCFVQATESAAQAFHLVKLLAEITGQQATFATLLDKDQLPQFHQEMEDIRVLSRLVVLSCARLTNLLRVKSAAYPPHSQLPLVKMQLQQKPPTDLRAT